MSEAPFSREEFARRGDEWYENHIRPLVEEGNHRRIVAIDIETGGYELSDSVLDACDRLKTRLPEAQIWIVRIGCRGVYHFGGSSIRRVS